MKCKVGDIALVVGSIAENLGRIVVVLAPSLHFTGDAGWLVRCVAGRPLGGRILLEDPIRPCACVTFLDGQLHPIPGSRMAAEERDRLALGMGVEV